jgi:hypothetical protein
MLTTSPLLPYLKSRESGFYLQLAVPSDHPDRNTAKGRAPFSIVHDTDPLTRLFSGKLVSDYGTRMQDVFLLTQRDVYQGGQHILWPLTNPDIDRFWQHTFQLYAPEAEAHRLFVLGRQVRDDALLPWGALFYCQRRDRFFHPPCPQCGSPLHQCTDDAQLGQQGLHSYTTTRTRYLTCPSCHQAERGAVFYAPSHDADDGQPVKDQQQLILAWGGLEVQAAEDSQFPCAGCPQFENCYQDREGALEAIVPFSFYPFYMLMFEAPTTSLAAFLPLVGGAAAGDIQPHQPGPPGLTPAASLNALDGNTGFVFSQTDNFFLEVLYLKLSLLSDLTRIIWPRRMDYRYPEATLGVDNIWASIPATDGRLPVLWSYACRVIGLATTVEPSGAVTGVPSDYGSQLLGNLWLYTLLTNARQPMREVQAGVSRFLSDPAAVNAVIAGENLDLTQHPVMAPENLLWQPQACVLPAAWQAYWQRAIQMGVQLLCAGTEGMDTHPEDPQVALDQLCKEIKRSLFSESVAPTPGESVDPDAAIRELLQNIADKWEAELQAASVAPELAERSEPALPQEPEITTTETVDDVVKETVVLYAQDFAAIPAPSKDPLPQDQDTVAATPETSAPASAQISDTDAAEELPQTIIFRASDAERKTPAAEMDQEEDLPETVIFSAPAASEKQPAAQTSQEEDLPETVIFKAPDTPQAKPDPPSASEEDMPETVIISASTAEQAKAQADVDAKALVKEDIPPPEDPSDDGLMETVIIKPKQPKR